MKIGYMAGFWWNEGLPGATDIALQDSLHISQEAAAEFRTLLSIPPGLTAEQAEVARFEARLEILCDGMERVQLWRYSAALVSFSYVIEATDGSASRAFNRPTRLAAAQACVETLEAEAAKKLPDVATMNDVEREAEIEQRGWVCYEHDDGRQWVWVREHQVIYMGDLRSADYEAALKEARKFDG